MRVCEEKTPNASDAILIEIERLRKAKQALQARLVPEHAFCTMDSNGLGQADYQALPSNLDMLLGEDKKQLADCSVNSKFSPQIMADW